MGTESLISSTDQESLGVLVSLVRSEIVRALEADIAAKGFDLRHIQFLILKCLAQMGPVSATELARAVELDGGAMTRQLDHLQSKGYLRRCQHEQDRRALRIELTDAGEAIWQQLALCHEHVSQTAHRLLSDAESTYLHRYLERVLHALRNKH